MTTKIIVKAEHNCGPHGKVIVGVVFQGKTTTQLMGPDESVEFTVWDDRRVFSREATAQDIADHT